LSEERCVATVKEITQYWSWRTKARVLFDSARLYLISHTRWIDRTSGWIRFPFYHHIFSDEQAGFCKQLEYMRNYGEFISLDSAVRLLHTGERIDGRYFCITFDDGIGACYDYAFPILADKGVPAAFFIVPEYVSSGADRDHRSCRPLPGLKMKVNYMTWDECMEMKNGGMAIGSHTYSHSRLSQLSDADAYGELRRSKEIIEKNLGGRCDHFACPWGMPGIDYIPEKHVLMAKEIGYKSFLTVQRGVTTQGDSPFAIRRDFLYANSAPYILRYFFGT